MWARMVNVPQLYLCLYRQTLVWIRCTRRGREPIFWMRVCFSSQTSTLLSSIVTVCQSHYSRFKSCGCHVLSLTPLKMKADSRQQSRAVQLLLHRREQDQLTRDKPRNSIVNLAVAATRHSDGRLMFTSLHGEPIG